MGHLKYRAIDVDNHYYEPLDAFTRHLDKRFRRRGVQMFSDGRHTQAIIGDRVNRFIPNPTFDPIIVPGCLDVLFRGEIPEGVDPASLMKVEKLELRPEYQHRDARVAVLESQGIETILVFPTFGCGVEEALRGDIEATMASLHAFNLWLDEDWGFDRQDHRILAAPMISLADPEEAVREIDFVLARGARLVHVRPAPVPGIPKNRSLGHRSHDPAWARLAEAGVPVAFHLGDSGYLKSLRCGAERKPSSHSRPRPTRWTRYSSMIVPSMTPWLRWSSTVFSIVIPHSGCQHRERFGMGASARQAAQEVG